MSTCIFLITDNMSTDIKDGKQKPTWNMFYKKYVQRVIKVAQ